MPEPALRVIGARELRRELKRAGLDAKDLTRAHRAVSEVIAADADPPVWTTGPHPGQLAATVRAGATQRSAVVRAGSARVVYPGPVHWGWPDRHIAGDPFLSDAATSSEGRWLPLYESEVDRLVASVKGASP